jgi:Protein of unknown function (DUF2911)
MQRQTTIFVLYENSCMKKTIPVIAFLFLTLFSVAQGSPLPPLDKSPMDMSYYPVNYPALKIQGKATGSAIARVIYSRPQKSGRIIFGELLEYGKVWRLGANEATELDLFKTARIGGKKIAKGRYTLYAIPFADKWTIIINKDVDIWGAFKYDVQKDVLRTDVPVEKLPGVVEALAMTFDKTENGFNLVIAWDNSKVSLPASFK